MRQAALPLLLLGACAAAGGAAGQNAAQADLEAQADRLEATADAAADGPDGPPPAEASAIRIACALAPRFLKEFDEGRQGLDAAERDALYRRFQGMEWRMLPRRGDCDGGRAITFQPEGFGEFVTAIAVDPDGRRVAIRGGWQLAPLAGGGGDCLFERVGATWQRKGCLQTWVS